MPQSIPFQNELEIAMEAAHIASNIITDYRNSEEFDISLKGKNDLVTDADVASEKAIISHISQHFPNDAFLAEETSNQDGLPDGRVWIIDPIDGTTNFAHGFPVYCVSIALWENKTPMVGLVKEVAKGELFYATKGGGAWLHDKKLNVSTLTDPSKSLLGTGFPYTSFTHVDEYLDLLKNLMQSTHGIRRPGAASYDLCCVAAGRFDGFFELGLSPWDVAAGALIILEAGGCLTDWERGDNWLLGKQIIGGNETILQFLQQQIDSHFYKLNA